MEIDKQKEKEFYELLKKRLEESTKFPSEYLYKFILPNGEVSIGKMYDLFKGREAKIDTKESSNKKYIAFSVKIKMDSVDEVISYYKEAGKIEGIVSL